MAGDLDLIRKLHLFEGVLGCLVDANQIIVFFSLDDEVEKSPPHPWLTRGASGEEPTNQGLYLDDSREARSSGDHSLDWRSFLIYADVAFPVISFFANASVYNSLDFGALDFFVGN